MATGEREGILRPGDVVATVSDATGMTVMVDGDAVGSVLHDRVRPSGRLARTGPRGHAARALHCSLDGKIATAPALGVWQAPPEARRGRTGAFQGRVAPRIRNSR
ncbi:hypothetical protein [Sorangium sp. So ce887]|uniref:hypothetical protein n=1 Tax=Sorangium sp. So ce887 TaxID=3133324 RepID=UPI003F5F8E07